MARIALVLSMLGLFVTTSAQAATVYSSSTYVASPALAGDRVLAEQVPVAGSLRVLSLPIAGGAPTTLLSAKRTGPGTGVGATYAAANGNVWLRRIVEGSAMTILSGPTNGPLTQVEDCPGDTEEPAPGPAADGDVAVWARAGCKQQQIHIQNGSTSRVVDAGDFVYAVAAAGQYVAWLRLVEAADPHTPTQTRLVVADAATGNEVYSALVSPSSNLQLEPDGTAVMSVFFPHESPCRGSGGSEHFVYYTRAEPFAHEVPGIRSCDFDFRVAGGRLAFVNTDAQRTIALTDLSGSSPQPVASLGTFPVGTFDFDGQHVAWSQVGCRSYSVHVRDAGDMTAADAAPRCPLVVGKPKLARDRTIHVPIRCPNGCRAHGKLNGMTITAPHFLHVWAKTRRGVRYAPYVNFDVKPGGRATLKLPTTAYQRAVIRRKRRVAVRLKTNGQNIYLPQIARTLTIG